MPGSRRLPLVIAFCALFVAACGSGEPPEPTATPTPTPVPFDAPAALQRSGRVMEALDSFHFRLHHERGDMELLPGLIIDEVEGDVINPDKLSVDFSGSFGIGFAIESSLITLGDEGYMTNPVTGDWEQGPAGVSSMGFFDPAGGIVAMMAQVSQARRLDDVTGKPNSYRIGGSLPVEALAPLVGTTLEGTRVVVELTIDSNDSYLLEARFDGPVTPTDSDDVVRVITLSAFDDPISIDAPF